MTVDYLGEPEPGCPIPQTHRRLQRAHRQWHEAEDAYPVVDDFLAALNTTLVTLRSVSFMLQSEKALIPDFATWYGLWQEDFATDPLMRWLVNARNRVEKQGDLDVRSRARVSVLASWDGPQILHEFEVPALLSPAEVVARVKLGDVPDQVRREGILIVERRWVSVDLPDVELLDVLAHGYGRLNALVVDAHEQLGFSMPTVIDREHGPEVVSTAHLGHRLPCMVHREWRSAQLAIGTGALIEIGRVVPRVTQRDARRVVKRYSELGRPPVGHPIENIEGWFEYACRMTERDGGHITIAVMFRGVEVIEMRQFEFENQRAKYVLLSELARDIERTGADGLVMIGEAWMVEAQELVGFRRPEDVPSRQSVIEVSAANSAGTVRTFVGLIKKTGRTTTVVDRREFDVNATSNYLKPVLEVWQRGADTKT